MVDGYTGKFLVGRRRLVCITTSPPFKNEPEQPSTINHQPTSYLNIISPTMYSKRMDVSPAEVELALRRLEKQRASMRAYYHRNAEERRAKQREYYHNNLEVRRAANRDSYNRRKGAAASEDSRPEPRPPKPDEGTSADAMARLLADPV